MRNQRPQHRPPQSSTPLVAAILALLSLFAPIARPADTVAIPEHGRALSLRTLQDMLMQCAPAGECPDSVYKLGYLSRVEGYVIDPVKQDIILIGQVHKDWPILRLEDLVIALRDAWGRHAVRRGNTVTYTNPGVSIDPDPAVIARLQKIGRRLQQSADENQGNAVLDDWHKACRDDQRVRVEGIPFNTRFAGIMLAADYHMKQLVDGSAKTALDGFTSLSDMHMEDAKQKVAKGKPVQLSSMSRFWFYPKPLTVAADRGAGFITGFGIQLGTEEEFLDQKGEITGKGAADPLASEWAEMLTARYTELAAIQEEYRELENLAWLLAIAKTLEFRQAPFRAKLDMGVLVDGISFQETPIPETVPGHSSVMSYSYRQEVTGGYIAGSLRLPSCGGVDMGIPVDKETFTDDGDGKLVGMQRSVLSQRPEKPTLYWDF